MFSTWLSTEELHNMKLIHLYSNMLHMLKEIYSALLIGVVSILLIHLPKKYTPEERVLEYCVSPNCYAGSSRTDGYKAPNDIQAGR